MLRPRKDLWNRVIDRWRQSDLTILPGATTDQIAAFETQYKVVLPPDVRGYFMTVNGMEETMDNDLFRFWPLEEVCPAKNEWLHSEEAIQQGRDLFVFADYCISCWSYGVKLTSNPNQPAPVYRLTGCYAPPEGKMTDSFSEFMNRYVEDLLQVA